MYILPQLSVWFLGAIIHAEHTKSKGLFLYHREFLQEKHVNLFLQI